MLKALLKYSCYVKISKICSLAHKHPIWKDYRFGEYHEIVAKYGLLSALKLQVINYLIRFTTFLYNVQLYFD